MKKITAILLALVLVLAMSTSAMAATITVSGAKEGETYSAYKIFDVTSDGDAIAYTISSESEWFSTVTGYTKDTDDDDDADGIAEYTGAGLTLIRTTTVTETAGEVIYSVMVSKTDFVAKNFAASLYAAISGKTAAATATASSTGATITVAEKGYYLVDSSLGALCALHTADDKVDVYEKNAAPTITKLVAENKTDEYAEKADADMNQTVYYELTVNTGSDTYNGTDSTTETGVDDDYVIVDELPMGMSYTKGDVVITVTTIEKEVDTEGNETKKEVVTTWTSGTDYSVEYTAEIAAVEGKEDDPETEENEAVAAVEAKGATMTITLLSTGKLASQPENTDIVITYSAVLEDDTDVVVGGNGNVNTVELTYKEQTDDSSATVYTYLFDMIKTDSSNKQLEGAEFRLYTDDKCTNEFALIYDETLKAYRPVASGETGTVITAGKITVTGLDVGTYYLKEVKAPTGYNPLAEAQKVEVTDTNNSMTVTTTEVKDESGAVTGTTTTITGGVQVINETGTKLPSTGGMGSHCFCGGMSP